MVFGLTRYASWSMVTANRSRMVSISLSIVAGGRVSGVAAAGVPAVAGGDASAGLSTWDTVISSSLRVGACSAEHQQGRVPEHDRADVPGPRVTGQPARWSRTRQHA